MGRRHIITLLTIVVLVALSVSVLSVTDIWGRDGMTLGLDLKGGVYLEYQADFGDRPDWEHEGRLEETRRIIEKRVNEWGVSEPNIYSMSPDRIVVQLPGFADIQGAKDLVGTTAELIFREPATEGETATAVAINASDTQVAVAGISGFGVGDVFGIGSGDSLEIQTIQAIDTGNLILTVTPGFTYSHSAGERITNLWIPATGLVDGDKKELAGRYLLPNSYVRLSQGTNLPEVAFEWDDDGTTLFSQITGRLIGQPMAIFLDNELIAAPTIQTQISRTGIIEGLDFEQAQRLAIQLNTGALPITLYEVRTQKIDPTLGADSLEKGMLAGIIGLSLLFIFMIAYYRLPGLLACFALLIYGSILLAIFKMWPVTLTLSGIAALILSIGMAVDANVLIFERMKEELRGGRTIGAAMETGFRRAWPAIRDSNVSTLITCIILFWFGNTFGAAPVMGFALTLGIGVAISMFTAIVVTRTFLRTILFTPFAKNLKLFRP